MVKLIYAFIAYDTMNRIVPMDCFASWAQAWRMAYFLHQLVEFYFFFNSVARSFEGGNEEEAGWEKEEKIGEEEIGLEFFQWKQEQLESHVFEYHYQYKTVEHFIVTLYLFQWSSYLAARIIYGLLIQNCFQFFHLILIAVGVYQIYCSLIV